MEYCKNIIETYITNTNIIDELNNIITEINPDLTFILTDTNTHKLCLPLLKGFKYDYEITIWPNDNSKNLDSLISIWNKLQEYNCTRHSLLINLGGGVVTDIGGFAASTFKRGIKFVNIPTTLLSIVDASIGGKTGINYNGYKNEIGVFSNPYKVIIDIEFLKTLDNQNFISGYGEMIKHALINKDYELLDEYLNYDLYNIDYDKLKNLIYKNIRIKYDIVNKDYKESGLRKSLNFGHTIGHAIESFLNNKTTVLHGYCVAWGIISELYISSKLLNFPINITNQIKEYVIKYYGKPEIINTDYNNIYKLILHDKKNKGTNINFVLLDKCKDIKIDTNVDLQLILESLKFINN